ncbi:MAG: DUF1674 domain-containing protein [Hyphomicrobiales bacterium]|nr:DUF1674 domain-containing protein [Hyphomicrobiales bacterium]MCP5372072.1 DUF1674 domain-containing protein [Hyphomicrobiales bacterium]
MAEDPKTEPQDQPQDQPRDEPRDETETPDTGAAKDGTAAQPAKEIGGRGGLDPSRYGDWEKNGRCIDF